MLRCLCSSGNRGLSPVLVPTRTQDFLSQSSSVQRSIYDQLIGAYRTLPSDADAIRLLNSGQISQEGYAFINQSRVALETALYRSGPLFLQSGILTPDEQAKFRLQNRVAVAQALAATSIGIAAGASSGSKVAKVSGRMTEAGEGAALGVKGGGTAYADGLAYRSDLPGHLAGPDGFTRSGQLSGTHNLQNATAALDAQGATYNLVPTSTTGISELQYSYMNAAGKTINGSKTVYDPAKYSDQAMLDMSQAAGQRGYELYSKNTNQRVFDLNQDGVNFRVYINIDPKTGAPFVGNVHPIK